MSWREVTRVCVRCRALLPDEPGCACDDAYRAPLADVPSRVALDALSSAEPARYRRRHPPMSRGRVERAGMLSIGTAPLLGSFWGPMAGVGIAAAGGLAVLDRRMRTPVRRWRIGWFRDGQVRAVGTVAEGPSGRAGVGMAAAERAPAAVVELLRVRGRVGMTALRRALSGGFAVETEGEPPVWVPPGPVEIWATARAMSIGPIHLASLFGKSRGAEMRRLVRADVACVATVRAGDLVTVRAAGFDLQPDPRGLPGGYREQAPSIRVARRPIAVFV